MKIKLLIIFLFILIITYIIFYKFESNKINVLLLSDNMIITKPMLKSNNELISSKYDINDIFSENDLTYKELESNIKDNYKVVFKNKVINILQAISGSDVIVISLENNDFFNKCKKSKTNQIEITNNSISKIVNKIKKVSDAKIIIIDNDCMRKEKYYNYHQSDIHLISLNEVANESKNNFKKLSLSSYESNELIKILYNYIHLIS